MLITNDVDEAIILADRIIALNPDGTLGDVFSVDIPRPRNRIAMNDNKAFKKLRADVTTYLMDVASRPKSKKPKRYQMSRQSTAYLLLSPRRRKA